MKKYVGQDLASREGKGVRLELFKERLGQHWDLVLNQVLGDLESIKVVKDRLLPHLEMQNQVALDFRSSSPQFSGA